MTADVSAGATVVATLTGIVAAAGSCVVTANVWAEGGVGNLNGRNAVGIEYTAARNWCRGGGAVPALDHEARFVAALSEVPVATIPTMRCFRGVQLARAPDDCGPPPSPPTLDNRYNRAGEIMLYMSDSELGVARELAERDGSKWVQEFDVPIAQLKIADFVALPDRHFVNHVFFNAERTGWPDTDIDYTFSQRVATLVRDAGFDGMIVRGSRDAYLNIVIFMPLEGWRPWIASAVRALAWAGTAR